MVVQTLYSCTASVRFVVLCLSVSGFGAIKRVPEDSEILEVESWNPEVLNALIFHHSSESQSIIKKMFQ